MWMDGWRSGPHGFIYVKDAHCWGHSNGSLWPGGRAGAQEAACRGAGQSVVIPLSCFLLGCSIRLSID